MKPTCMLCKHVRVENFPQFDNGLEQIEDAAILVCKHPLKPRTLVNAGIRQLHEIATNCEQYEK